MGKRFLIQNGLAALVALAGTAPACAQNAGPLGEMAGYGVSVTGSDSENLLGNLAGGVKTGATLQGVLTLAVSIDTGKAFGLAGGTFHVSALQLHGRPLSPYYLGDLQAANGNEGDDATRLWELWFDQQFLNNTFDIKIGQQSIDNEFLVSANSGLFVNTMAGWPLVPSVDLYGGGPAYPLSSPGIRLQAETGGITVLAGVFDDNPGGGGFADDAQALDNGTRFNLNTGALWIAELQYATRLAGLAGTYKLGAWFDSGHFPDQLFDADGLSLADPASGEPKMDRGNDTVYGVVDQTLWQSKTDAARSLNAFGRVMGAPDRQNLVRFSFNGGVTLAAPLPGRDNDLAGVDFGLGEVSRRAAELDGESGRKRRGSEELIELTYQAALTPWLTLQPDLQYILTPGGGLADPDDPGHSLRNEIVAGARAVVSF